MHAAVLPQQSDSRAPAKLRSLIEELNAVKRMRSAGLQGSVASRAFRNSWAALLAGAEPLDLALNATAALLTAARLGDLDRQRLMSLGMSEADAIAVIAAAFDAIAANVEPALKRRLRAALAQEMPNGVAPEFVSSLEAQPRAGIASPGLPRLILEPPENHAEHCMLVAVYGVLFSPSYDADLETVFLAGLAHHLHNAVMPDIGYAGELALGPHLDGLVEVARIQATDQLPAKLQARVAASRQHAADIGTPEGRAFHAADVLDRVTEIAQRLRAGSLSIHRVLAEMDLVHDGPFKTFHDDVLRGMGLP